MTKRDREEIKEILRKGNLALIFILISAALITILSFWI